MKQDIKDIKMTIQHRQRGTLFRQVLTKPLKRNGIMEIHVSVPAERAEVFDVRINMGLELCQWRDIFNRVCMSPRPLVSFKYVYLMLRVLVESL